MQYADEGSFLSEFNCLKRLSVGAWRSLVAHLFWVQGVVSSNLAAPTIVSNSFGGTKFIIAVSLLK